MDILRRIELLTKEQKRALADALRPLSDNERMFANEYTVDLDKRRAAEVSGFQYRPMGTANKLLNDPAVAAEVQKLLKLREEKTGLTAEYVREYMVDTLELDPLEFFEVSPEGGWLITTEKLKDLPLRVRRQIQGIELRWIRGAQYLAVQLVNKTSVLGLAARYTLTQKHSVNVSQVPWDELAESAAKRGDGEDPLEAKLRAIANGDAA